MDKLIDFSLKDYLTIEEVANLLNCSERTAREFIKNIVDVKVVKVGIANKHYYNKQEVLKIQDMQQKQQQLAHIDNKAQTMANNYDKDIVANAFIKQIENESSEDILKSSLYLMEIALKKVAEKNKELTRENELLSNETINQQEIIDNYKLLNEKKINRDKLFSLLNNKIREIAKYNFNNDYSKSYNYFYAELQARHNFYHSINMTWLRKKENIEYAKELLEIVLNY